MIYDDQGRLLVGRRAAIVWGVGRDRFLAAMNALRPPSHESKRLIGTLLLEQVARGETTAATASFVMDKLDELQARRRGIGRLISIPLMTLVFLALMIIFAP
jgi:hypothetical protein